ncbi:MAG TPA: Maf family protein [Planktothrix sp.]|jgi:septum formation protein
MSNLSKANGEQVAVPVEGADNESSQWHFILASGSPRRRQLIKNLHLSFDVVTSEIEEIVDERLTPGEVVLDLARQKAQDVWNKTVARRCDEDDRRLLILGADTLVALDGALLGKPKDRQDAARVLRNLSGRRHEVYTGVVLLIETAGGQCKELAQSQVSHVYFRDLQENEILAYSQLDEPMDKAGSYALQGTASAFVERVEGCYSNIIGLPVPLVVSLLRQAGVQILGCGA